MLCFLPLYHIYGLTVGLNLSLMRGCTLVLMPRFDCERSLQIIVQEGVTVTLCVPPTLLAYCQAAEQGKFPREHRLRWVKSGAAPLAPELARRFTAEHRHSDPPGLRNDRGVAGHAHGISCCPNCTSRNPSAAPVAQTECRVVDENENDVAPGEIGELVMRGPQFMLGYWKSPDATRRRAARRMVLVGRHRSRRRRRPVLTWSIAARR